MKRSPERQVRLRERPHQPLREAICLDEPPRADERPNLGQHIFRGRIVPVRRPTRPERVVVQLQVLDADVPEHHRADAAVANRKRLDPLRRGASVGEQERRSDVSVPAAAPRGVGLALRPGAPGPVRARRARGASQRQTRERSRETCGGSWVLSVPVSVVSTNVSFSPVAALHASQFTGCEVQPDLRDERRRTSLVDRDANLVGLRVRNDENPLVPDRRARTDSRPPLGGHRLDLERAHALAQRDRLLQHDAIERHRRRQRQGQARMRRALGRSPERVGVAIERTGRLEPVA